MTVRESPGAARLKAEEGLRRNGTAVRDIVDQTAAPLGIDQNCRDLTALETAIERGLATFLEVGQALTIIRDNNLYGEAGYDTFETYLHERWHMARQSGYDYIHAAAVVANVRPAVHEPLPSLTHATMLYGLPVPEQIELASQVIEQHGTIKWLRRQIADKQHAIVPREHRQVLAVPNGQLPDTCRIEVGDARRLPLVDGEAHLVVTSPPYNARINYDGYEDWLPWDEYWSGLIEPSLREAYRVLAPGGRLCLNMPNVVRTTVADPTRGGRATQYQSRSASERGHDAEDTWPTMIGYRLWNLLVSIGFLPREQITWCKGQEPGDEDGPTALTSTSTAWGTFCSARNPVVRAVAEPLFIADKLTHSREPGLDELTPEEFKRFSKNIWFIPAFTPDLDGFPSAFPEELPRRLIKFYSYPGDLVVDPFVGSGTTALAAASLGRRSYGCDVSAHSVALARARVVRGVAA